VPPGEMSQWIKGLAAGHRTFAQAPGDQPQRSRRDGVLGRVHVEADDVADLGDELRVVLSFQVSTTCGLRPKARQIRE